MKKSMILDMLHVVRGHIDTLKPMKNNYASSGIYEELKSKLNPELRKLLLKYIDESDYENADEVDFYFAEGFKLGLLIGIEVMDE